MAPRTEAGKFDDLTSSLALKYTLDELVERYDCETDSAMKSAMTRRDINECQDWWKVGFKWEKKKTSKK